MVVSIITVLCVVAILVYTVFRAVEDDHYDNTGEEEFERRMKERYSDWKGL